MSIKYRHHDGQYSEARNPNQWLSQYGGGGLRNRDIPSANDSSNTDSRADCDASSGTGTTSQRSASYSPTRK